MKLSIFFPSVLLGFIFSISIVWAVDPNINAQSTDLRSNGADGSPGFNPCLGGTRDTNGLCGGSANPAALLSPQNLTLFSKLGPGAVTDNMFGIVEQPLNPGACGPTGSGGSSEVGGNELNCGNVFFNPRNQGQTNLGGKNTLMTASPVNFNMNFNGDFCEHLSTDCLDNGGVQIEPAHVGFNLVNNFSWNQTSDSTADVISSQTVTQITALKSSGIGTLPSPGTGDQLFSITNDFLTSSTNSENNVGSPLIMWSLTIEDPDQSGTGLGKWKQSLAGSFTLNSLSEFPSVQYPSGQSQTNQNNSSFIP